MGKEWSKNGIDAVEAGLFESRMYRAFYHALHHMLFVCDISGRLFIHPCPVKPASPVSPRFLFSFQERLNVDSLRLILGSHCESQRREHEIRSSEVER
jgi:hypothetical protein